MEKSKTMHMRLSESIDEKVTEMAEYDGLTRTAIIRNAINEKYKGYAKERYGYQSGSATGKLRVGRANESLEQNAKLKEIRQLIEKGDYSKVGDVLYELEYCKPPTACSEDDGFGPGWVSYETVTVFPGFGPVGFYHFKYNSDKKQYRDRRMAFTVDELIKDLIKNKYV